MIEVRQKLTLLVHSKPAVPLLESILRRVFFCPVVSTRAPRRIRIHPKKMNLEVRV